MLCLKLSGRLHLCRCLPDRVSEIHLHLLKQLSSPPGGNCSLLMFPHKPLLTTSLFFFSLFVLQSHNHMHDSCHHGHSGHCHNHGPKVAAFGGLANPLMPSFHGQFGMMPDQAMEVTQQLKKRSHLDDSSSWDIVKATQ